MTLAPARKESLAFAIAFTVVAPSTPKVFRCKRERKSMEVFVGEREREGEEERKERREREIEGAGERGREKKKKR